jgi:hypothetical protein
LKTYDAIVVGAGHNGLTTAAFLAKAGLDVVCVEKNDYIGGAAVSRELHKDWIYSNCSYVCSLLRPEIFQALELHRHGLQITPFGGSVQFMENGDYFGAYQDPEVSYREMARFSRHDADMYKTYRADTMRQCRFIRDFLLSTAPDPTSFRPRDIRELLHIGGKFWEMGEDRMYETIRFWTMSVAEYLDQYFETEVIKAAKSGSGIIGTALGVHSPGTAYVLLHHYMGEVDGNVGSWGFARGGMGSVSKAIAGAFQEAGGELRTEAGVDKIIVRNGKAEGVALENGEEISGRLVVSAMDVKRTFLQCMGRVGDGRQANLPAVHGCRRCARSLLPTRRELQDPGFIGQGEHCAGRSADVSGSARGQLPDAQRHALHRLHGAHGAGLRRLEGGHLVERSLRRHGDPDSQRSDDGAARKALHERLRAVLSAPDRGPALDHRGKRRLRPDRDRPDR